MSFIKEHLSVITVIAGAVASLLAYQLGANKEVIFSAIILVTILFLLAVSYFNSSQDQYGFYNFFSNSLSPNKTKKLLGLKTEVVVVEAKDGQEFFENFIRSFKEINELKVSHFVCDSSDVKLQEDKLKDILTGAEAVIVVRTEELENKSWVYDTLQSWAIQNSHVACLVIDKISPLKTITVNPVPEKYYFIPEDVTSLPWRLLKRANERSHAWRNQAAFNRLVAIALFSVLLISIVLYFYGRPDQRADAYKQQTNTISLIRKMYDKTAIKTKSEFIEKFLEANSPNNSLHVSYWFQHGDAAHYLVVTDPDDKTRDPWPRSKPSAIGCVFFENTNATVLWTSSSQKVEIFRDGQWSLPPWSQSCGFKQDDSAKIKSIICTSYNLNGASSDNIVGICAYVRATDVKWKKDYSIKDSQGFLEEKAKVFYEDIHEILLDISR